MMGSKGDDLPEGDAGKPAPGRGSRRLWPAIDARRRLNARPADGIRTGDRNQPRSSDPTPGRRAKRDRAVAQVRTTEGELNRDIVRRAKRFRERAAQSLRRSRRSDQDADAV